MLRRVGYSDKMPSVAQSRVLQAWRLEREKRANYGHLHIRVGGLGLVSLVLVSGVRMSLGSLMMTLWEHGRLGRRSLSKAQALTELSLSPLADCL